MAETASSRRTVTAASTLRQFIDPSGVIQPLAFHPRGWSVVWINYRGASPRLEKVNVALKDKSVGADHAEAETKEEETVIVRISPPQTWRPTVLQELLI